MTAPAHAADPFDHRIALGATGLLAAFNAAGVLTAADVHVATRLGRLGGEPDETVLLALALAVRGVRLGSVCVEPATLHRTVLGESDDPAAVAALPWPDPPAWPAACTASSLVANGPDGPAGRPARLVGELLYLERYWRQEEQVRRELQQRSAPVPPADLDLDRLRAGLARHFPDATPTNPSGTEPGSTTGPRTHPAPTGASAELGAAHVDHQRLAAAVSAVRRLSVLAGGPGTGKTTTVARLLALLAASRPAGRPPLRIALAAPTGKAASRLEDAVGKQVATFGAEDRERLGELRASTLHRLLGLFPGARRARHDHTDRLPHDVVVVDETSMVSLTLMARLLDALRPDARLVLVGDPDQLASVEAGAVLGDLTRAAARAEPELVTALHRLGVAGADEVVNGVVTLRHTHRFRGAIARLARAIQAGDADAAVAVLRAGDSAVEFVERADDVPAGLSAPVRAGVRAGVPADVLAAARRLTETALDGDTPAALAALDAHRLLCGHRRGPFGAAWWGAQVERRLAAAGGPGTSPADPWYPGRPIVVTANDHDAGLYNGDTGVVVRTPDGPRVAFARATGPVLVSPARLGEVQTVHAMTVHRAQGSQFAAVTVVVPPAGSPLLTRELLYTAVTRAREAVRLIGSEAAVRAAVARPVSRASGLRHRLGRAGASDPRCADPPAPDGAVISP